MRLSILLALALLFPASHAAAQGAPSSQRWTLCTPGDVRSCGTLALYTDAVRTGATRTGTSVSLRVTNLQGALVPEDNTLWSFFRSMVFLGHFSGMLGTSAPQSLTLELPGQSPEPNSWVWQSGEVLGADGSPLSMLTVYSPELRSTIAGCDTVDPEFGPDYPSIYTCGASAFALLAFDSPSIFDASEFETVRLNAQAMTAASSDIELAWCNAFPDRAAQDPAEEACSVLAHEVVAPPPDVAVVPEPATLVLVGGGLAALLLGRRRYGCAGGRRHSS